jgi:hypothetical protein
MRLEGFIYLKIFVFGRLSGNIHAGRGSFMDKCLFPTLYEVNGILNGYLISYSVIVRFQPCSCSLCFSEMLCSVG